MRLDIRIQAFGQHRNRLGIQDLGRQGIHDPVGPHRFRLRHIERHGKIGRGVHNEDLTVHDSLESKIEGLNSGGDDYLTKAFAFCELLARVDRKLEKFERLGLYVLAPTETIGYGWFKKPLDKADIRQRVERRVQA